MYQVLPHFENINANADFGIFEIAAGPTGISSELIAICYEEEIAGLICYLLNRAQGRAEVRCQSLSLKYLLCSLPDITEAHP